MTDVSPSERTESEQECLKRIWPVLQRLRYEIANPPIGRRTKPDEQLSWFDRVFEYTVQMKTASSCFKHATKLDKLGDAVVKAVGPKRLMTDDPAISPSDRRNLLDRLDTLSKSLQHRMSGLRVQITKSSPPTINIGTTGTKFVWVIGVVSLYPVMFSQLAREFEWPVLAPALTAVGALLSFFFFIEITAILVARPFWVFDPDAAGKITYPAVKQGWWPVLVLITLLLFLFQLYWLVTSLWLLTAPLGTAASTILVAVTIGVFSVVFYPWAKWRYNQFLFCPVCGAKEVSHEALDVHCRHDYGFSLMEIVEFNLKTAKKASKNIKKERRKHTFLFMGVFYFLVEVFFYIQYRDLNAFLMLSTICVFFLILDVLQGDYISYKETKASRSPEQVLADREATTAVAYAAGLSLISTFGMGSIILVLYSTLPGIDVAQPYVLCFTYNVGLGTFIAFPLLVRKPNLILRGLSFAKVTIPLQNVLLYSVIAYLTDLMLGLWASTVVLPEYVGYAFTYGVFAGFVILLLIAREVRSSIRKDLSTRTPASHT